jgi:hypothetical protein
MATVLKATLQSEFNVNINNKLLRQLIQWAKNSELTTSILEEIEKGLGKSAAEIAAIRKAQAEDLAKVTTKVKARAEAGAASKDCREPWRPLVCDPLFSVSQRRVPKFRHKELSRVGSNEVEVIGAVGTLSQSPAALRTFMKASLGKGLLSASAVTPKMVSI